MPLARFPCIKCQTWEIHTSDRGHVRCCQCNTPWRPLSLAESAKFNSRTVRVAAENADAMARQRAKNSHAKFYLTSAPMACGHFERYLKTERCRICTLTWQAQRYQQKYDSTPHGRSAARDAALESRARTYVDGPCKVHGFGVERYTGNRWCVRCAKESSAAKHSRIEAVA